MAITEKTLRSWSNWMKAASATPDTIEQRTYHIRRVMSELGVSPWEVTTEQLINYLSSKNWKPNTRRSYRGSLRSLYRWAVDQGHVETSPAHPIPPVQGPTRGAATHPGARVRRGTAITRRGRAPGHHARRHVRTPPW